MFFKKNKVVQQNDPEPSTKSRRTEISEHFIKSLDKPSPATDALNQQIVQAVQFTNTEVTAQAPTQLVVPPEMMIGQASGLVAQSAATYFDSVNKMALASKAILMKQMTESITKKDVVQAGEDALGILMTDVLVGSAAAVAAAAGAMEAESASFAIDKINQSMKQYQDLINKK